MPMSWRVFYQSFSLSDGTTLLPHTTRSSLKLTEKRTLVVDLQKPLDALWSGLKGKTRNVVRKSQKLGCEINFLHAGPADIDNYWDLLKATLIGKGIRRIHSKRFFESMFSQLSDCEIFMARVSDGAGEVLSAGVFIISDATCFFLSGANTMRSKTLGASSLLQWGVISHAKKMGCVAYDLGGLGNENVDRFKGGFGGEPLARPICSKINVIMKAGMRLLSQTSV